jgi:hypothetical protein
MRIGEDNFVAVTHLGEELEQVGTDAGMDSF